MGLEKARAEFETKCKLLGGYFIEESPNVYTCSVDNMRLVLALPSGTNFARFNLLKGSSRIGVIFDKSMASIV